MNENNETPGPWIWVTTETNPDYFGKESSDYAHLLSLSKDHVPQVVKEKHNSIDKWPSFILAIANEDDMHLISPEDMQLIAAAPAMKQRLEFAKTLLLQGNVDGALLEIEQGLAGHYEE